MIPVAAGYPDYSASGAGLNKLIPIIFSGRALERFYERTCLKEISNTDYVGEISDMGDKIIIPTIPDVPIKDYKKGMLLDVDYLESPAVEMTVDFAKSYNFAIDDIDQKQMKIKDWISKYAVNAAMRVKIGIETHVLGSIYADAAVANKGATAGKISQDLNLGVTGTPVTFTKANIIDYILYANQVLDEQDRPDDGRWMVLPSWAVQMLKASDLKDASMTGDDKSPIRNGRVGMIDRMMLYGSNLVAKDAGTSNYHIPFGHISAFTFVNQFVKTEKYRPERTFSDAMKGLSVYGFKVLQPGSLGEIVAKKG